jgi:RNA polymerase sigma-70 factor (sigma-E family)
MDVVVQSHDFDEWMAARVPGLLRFAYLVTGDRHSAEEAVQTALASVFERWSSVRESHDVDQYVRRSVVNAHVSAWRKHGRRVTPVAEVRSATAAANDPSSSVSRADAVWRVCSRLPRRQRAAVVLRFYEDLDYPEIAAILDCGESTVRSHIHRGLAALRAELERQETDPDG